MAEKEIPEWLVKIKENLAVINQQLTDSISKFETAHPGITLWVLMLDDEQPTVAMVIDTTVFQEDLSSLPRGALPTKTKVYFPITEEMEEYIKKYKPNNRGVFTSYKGEGSR